MNDVMSCLPEHVQDLFVRSCDHITFREAVLVAKLLFEMASAFSIDDFDLGDFSGVKHKITLAEGTKPVKHRTRPTPLHFREQEAELFNKMVALRN